jgi:hypothetical protein
VIDTGATDRDACHVCHTSTVTFGEARWPNALVGDTFEDVAIVVYRSELTPSAGFPAQSARANQYFLQSTFATRPGWNWCRADFDQPLAPPSASLDGSSTLEDVMTMPLSAIVCAGAIAVEAVIADVVTMR